MNADLAAPLDADVAGPVLCLSGGGFRATLLHLGALVRLNELGVLRNIRIIASVSGGSILNGVLAHHWRDLIHGSNGTFSNFHIVVDAVRAFCNKDLRTRVVIGGRLWPQYWLAMIYNLGALPGNALIRPYDELFGCRKLSHLPGPTTGGPRFVFCATSVETGLCWHFHGGADGRMGDFHIGYCHVGPTKLSEAVAASSAFPPGFGALCLKLPADPDRIDPWGRVRPPTENTDRIIERNKGKKVLLTDGGVYDNLGVEPFWNDGKRFIISDAGHPFSSKTGGWQALIARLKRVADISATQVGAVRKRWLMEEISRQTRLRELADKNPQLAEDSAGLRFRAGTLWGIDTIPRKFPQRTDSWYELEVLKQLAAVRTDLNRFSDGEQGCLQNHGYWLADAAIRSYATDMAANPGAAFSWPCPDWSPGSKNVEGALAGSDKRHLIIDAIRWGLGGLVFWRK